MKATHNLSLSPGRFVWYRVAKVGTRTINSILSTHVDDYRYFVRGEPYPDYEKMVRNSAECFSFCFVRDPWSRLESAWQNKVGNRILRGLKMRKGLIDMATEVDVLDFAAFVSALPHFRVFDNDPHFMPQAVILDGIHPTFTGYFSSFEADLRSVLKRLNIDSNQVIPHANASRPRATWVPVEYTPELVDMVTSLYRQDIERWGFEYGR